MRWKSGISLGLGLSWTASAMGAPQTITSPETRVSLMELYTSEGCDSCPPAEAWLSSLTGDSRLWRQLVPVAFHVDYWDDLGWRDRYDSPAYTARQQATALHAGNANVYTPEFVLDGGEWRDWFGHRPLSLPAPAKAGVLSLGIDGYQVKVHFAPSSATGQPLEVHAVLLAFGVQTHVGAGENLGAVLVHDFLVLSYGRARLTPGKQGYAGELVLDPTKVKATRYALAAWVSPQDDPEPLQAAGGWINAPQP